MNIGTIICLLLAVVFGMISMIFALLKEKGAMLISGFNTLSKDEQANYDQKKMSIDMRNSLFLWSILLLSGALFGYFLSQYGAFLAIVIWLILFSKMFILIQKKPLRNIGIHKISKCIN
ncbi:DUF3784 domain-containing protein [Ureibacillus sp. FSL K6-3587]|uniref:DUF3784 domain-containing protein n=1 Tax=Ureibacillus sp. FSL K6-3587 TaxID=2954681 RepID=UPI003158D976